MGDIGDLEDHVKGERVKCGTWLSYNRDNERLREKEDE